MVGVAWAALLVQVSCPELSEDSGRRESQAETAVGGVSAEPIGRETPSPRQLRPTRVTFSCSGGSFGDLWLQNQLYLRGGLPLRAFFPVVVLLCSFSSPLLWSPWDTRHHGDGVFRKLSSTFLRTSWGPRRVGCGEPWFTRAPGDKAPRGHTSGRGEDGMGDVGWEGPGLCAPL